MASAKLTALSARGAYVTGDLLYVVPSAGAAEYKGTINRLASFVIANASTEAGVDAHIIATAPAQITTSQVGREVITEASNAVAGSGTNGAAAGGGVNFYTGGARRLNTGNANGGDFYINLGGGIGTGTAGRFYIEDDLGNTIPLALVPSQNSLNVLSSGSIGWSSSAIDATTAPDTYLTRVSAGVIGFGVGVAGNIRAIAPAAIATAQSGLDFSIVASGAVAGSSVVGAASGGDVFLQAGNSARLTSGNAKGGNVQLLPGAGVGTSSYGHVVAKWGSNFPWSLVPTSSSAGHMGLGADVKFGWSSAADSTVNQDTVFERESSGVIGQRSVGTAQILKVYFSYTDASNFVRSIVSGTSTSAIFGAETGGTGADDIDVNLVPAGAGIVATAAPMQILAGTAIPAGGTAAKGYRFSSTDNYGVFFGSGVPTLSAAQGSLYLRSNGGLTTGLYSNLDGGTSWGSIATSTSALTAGALPTADITITSQTTMQDIVSLPVLSGHTYLIECWMPETVAVAGGGMDVTLGGTATATYIKYTLIQWGGVPNSLYYYGEVNALGTETNVVNAGAGTGSTTLYFQGTIVVNAGGTLILQAAQATSSVNSLVIRRGSSMRLMDIT